MSEQRPWKKVAIFGLLGALGCLVGWALGEPFLYVTMSAADSAGAGRAPSLISRPVAPKTEDAPTIARPVVPPVPDLPEEARKERDARGGKSGEIEIILEWWDANDLDLFCKEPDGTTIYFEKPTSPKTGGFLDIDTNFKCVENINTKNPVEHIRWRAADSARPRDGQHSVLVNHYMGCAASATPNRSKYKVTVKCGLDPLQVHEGPIENQGTNNNVTPVCTFTVAPRAEIFVPKQLEVYPGSTVRVPVVIRTAFHTGNVGIEVTALPEGVTAESLTIPSDKTEGEIVLRASDAARPGRTPIQFRTVGVKERGTAETHLVVQPPKIEIFAPSESISLPAGTTAKLPVTIRRVNYKGPVDLSVRNLPDGVTASKVSLKPEQVDAEIELETAATAKDGKFSPQVVGASGTATGSADLNLAIPAPPAAKFSLWLVIAIGFWTALLAVGLSLALLVGQNRYLGRGPFAGGRAPLIALGAAGAGLASGSIGQTLYILLLSVGVPEPGFIIGWSLLGGLLGWGVSFFIPNLDWKKAALAGLVGGGLGALAFIGASRGGEYLGRLVGGAVLGVCIGAMVAMVEAAFRSAWLEVRFSGGETIKVNLGPEPVKVGGDSRQCTVWARGAAPVALRFWVREGQVVLSDGTTNREDIVPNGYEKTVGSVQVVVRTAAGAAPERTKQARPPAKAAGAAHAPLSLDDEDDFLPAPTPARKVTPVSPPVAPKPAAPLPPKPPAPVAAKLLIPPPPKPSPPVTKPSASAQADPDACPYCGNGKKHPGTPGKRYCIIHDQYY